MTISFWVILSFPGLVLALITFIVPRELIKLYISWYIILVLLSYTYTMQVPYYPSGRFSGLDDEVFWANVIVSGLAILIKIVYTLNFNNENSLLKELLENELSEIFREIHYFTFMMYVLLFIYLIYLFFT